MKLSIPEPCHENWYTMTPTEKGRFCSSCEKEVMDFSEMSKSEIKEYFVKKVSENTCGRFKKVQLEELNKPNQNLRKINAKPWWVAAATFFMVVKTATSQTIAQKDSTQLKSKIEASKEKAPVAMEAPKPQNVDCDETVLSKLDTIKRTIVIKGRLMESDTTPLIFANVLLKNTSYGVSSDIDGYFTLKIPHTKCDTVILSFNYVGFEKKELKVFSTKDTIDLGEILLNYSQTLHTVGFIVYQTPTQRFFGRIRGFFWRLFHLRQ